MLPRLSSRLCWKITALLAAGFVGSPALRAQQDAPVDATKFLNALHSIQDSQSGLMKTDKTAAIQQAAAGAGSPEKAVAMWEQAIMATQFQGAGHESTQFQAWKAGDGVLYKEHLVQNALQLYFNWLQITIQRSAGAKVKDLLPAIISYTTLLAADQASVAPIEDAIKREEAARHQMEMEANAGKQAPRGPKPKNPMGNINDVKKLHDAILNKPLAGSTYVKWQRLMDWVNVDAWEPTPGNFNGIYDNVILPEMRATRDPRLMGYWDMMLKKTADEANRSGLAFDVDKYNNIVMPSLLWGKYGDMVVLGQKNEGFTNMLSLIKKYPTHPDEREWVTQFETLLAPPPTPAPGATPLPGAAVPGAVTPR